MNDDGNNEINLVQLKHIIGELKLTVDKLEEISLFLHGFNEEYKHIKGQLEMISFNLERFNEECRTVSRMNMDNSKSLFGLSNQGYYNETKSIMIAIILFIITGIITSASIITFVNFI